MRRAKCWLGSAGGAAEVKWAARDVGLRTAEGLVRGEVGGVTVWGQFEGGGEEVKPVACRAGDGGGRQGSKQKSRSKNCGQREGGGEG